MVFNNYRQRPDGFEDATDLRAGGNVAVVADLRTTPNEGMRINHRAFSYVRAHIHKHGRHANDSAANVAAIANAGAAGNDSDAIRRRERARGVSSLVKERLLYGIDGHVGDSAHAKSQENSLLDPGVCPPSGFRGGVWFGCADFPAIQPGLEIAEKPEVFFFVVRRGFVKQTLNLRRQHEPSAQVRVIREPRGCVPDFPPSAGRVATATRVRAGPSPSRQPSPGSDSTRQN